MGERRTPTAFEARQAHMADVVNYVMNNHKNPRFQIGWSLGGYKSTYINGEFYNAFYPESITAVRKAASIGLAAATKKEILDQAKRYAQIGLPDDEERASYAGKTIENIKAMINRAGATHLSPTMDFKKQFAMQFAKLELLSDTEGLNQTYAEMEGRVHPLPERLQFVAGLTGIIMTEIDDMFDNYPARPRPPRARTSVDTLLNALDDLGIR